MIALLAVIGLAAILWLVSRALVKVGTALEKIGDDISIREATFRVRNKTKSFLAKEPSDEYLNQVRSEIEEITKGD